MIYDGDTSATSTNAGREREREITNCELSDRDTRELDLQNPTMFDTSSFDYYERSNGRSGSDTECLDGKSGLFRKTTKYEQKSTRKKDEVGPIHNIF